MDRPAYLYHGSVRKIEGEELLPKQARGLTGIPEDMCRAVYATNIREIAIAMAIGKCRGVNGFHLNFEERPLGIIYDGWPEQEHVYLYTLPSTTFEQKGGGGKQWCSSRPVKPSKVERLSVKEFIHLVRKATDKEREDFFGKYKDKIPSRSS